ncbi:ATP-binding cassette domain-containing protein [Nocardioides campestrisoli]|uniref:ATP-binding cassette domain-containing protein n=1 Tax=Nocardioides campestrisoli TaxID=2736757 RepID=UPI0028127894|nr:ATP-binding cassette domain-containing protein [Nocardioides campestrisoli]
MTLSLPPPVETPAETPAGAPDQPPAEPRTPLLQVEDLVIAFQQYDRGLRRRVVTAVAGMSLDVHAGEVVALVGASGAGKSLLGHAVLGLLPPNAHEQGRIRWRGDEVDLPARRALAGRQTALLPQSLTHLDPSATVGAQARRSARLLGASRREARVRAREAVREQGLADDVLSLYPHQLSGGMGRRVLTALALMGDPALVVADEPTPGLGPDQVAAVLDRLHRIAQAGSGVLLITHELGPALRVADRVVVARRGRTVEHAPAAAFAGDGSLLTHPYSRALWRALPQNDFAVDPTVDAETVHPEVDAETVDPEVASC